MSAIARLIALRTQQIFQMTMTGVNGLEMGHEIPAHQIDTIRTQINEIIAIYALEGTISENVDEINTFFYCQYLTF